MWHVMPRENTDCVLSTETGKEALTHTEMGTHITFAVTYDMSLTSNRCATGKKSLRRCLAWEVRARAYLAVE